MGTIIKQYGIMMVEIIGIILCIGILVGIATNVGESTALQAKKMENAINADWAVVDTEGAEDVIGGEVIAAINDKLNNLDDSVVSLSTGLANTNTNLATKTNQLESNITNINNSLSNQDGRITTISGLLSQSKEGQFILPSGLKLQWGTIVTGRANDNVSHKTLIYPTAYSSTPQVFVMPVSGYGNLREGLDVTGRSASVSTVQCSVYLYSTAGLFTTSSSNEYRTARWFAIGY